MRPLRRNQNGLPSTRRRPSPGGGLWSECCGQRAESSELAGTYVEGHLRCERSVTSDNPTSRHLSLDSRGSPRSAPWPLAPRGMAGGFGSAGQYAAFECVPSRSPRPSSLPPRGQPDGRPEPGPNSRVTCTASWRETTSTAKPVFDGDHTGWVWRLESGGGCLFPTRMLRLHTSPRLLDGGEGM